MFRTKGSMRLDKLRWYPHWVFCTFRKNTNMPSTLDSQTMSNDMLSGLTSMCKGIDAIDYARLKHFDGTQHDFIMQLLQVHSLHGQTQSKPRDLAIYPGFTVSESAGEIRM
jgi:hypothetical protein